MTDDSKWLSIPGLGWRRLGLCLAVALTALAGGFVMWSSTQAFELALRLPLLALFLVTFSWIALAFWSALCGLLLCLSQRDPLSLEKDIADTAADRPHGQASHLADTTLQGRTALLMPICHEPPVSTLAGLEASCRSLTAATESAGLGSAGAHFDAFILSDSQDPEQIGEEIRHVADLQRRLQGTIDCYYRRRQHNEGRKAGNIAEFCRRWGRHYHALVVLDADSIMGGNTLLRLTRKLSAWPEVGLIQSVPIPVGQQTLFGRLVQFAAALYSPMLAVGQSFWQGDTANYWGHNAIIRTRAFMASSGLPVLKGAPPLGGELLSHDFVEAALLRRHGWKTLLDTTASLSEPDHDQSFEAMPSNLPDFAQRDRRWFQGNLQHLTLVFAQGLHGLSRWHLFLGAFAFLASPIWLALLAGATWLSIAPMHDGNAAAASSPASGWPLGLLVITLILLLAPKLFAMMLAWHRSPSAYGGRLRLCLSTLFEVISAALLAPLMMLWHSQFLFVILIGRAVGWGAQPRSERWLGTIESFIRGAPAALIGIAWVSLLLIKSPLAALWLAPAWLGLVLAPLIIRASASTWLANRLRLHGLLATPYLKADGDKDDTRHDALNRYQQHLTDALKHVPAPAQPLLRLPRELNGDMPVQSFYGLPKTTRLLNTSRLKEPL